MCAPTAATGGTRVSKASKSRHQHVEDCGLQCRCLVLPAGEAKWLHLPQTPGKSVGGGDVTP